MNDNLYAILSISAIIISPIVAIGVDRYISKLKSKKKLKEYIFETLMSIRSDLFSEEHVKIINMIGLAYYGIKILNIHIPSKKNRAVEECWIELLDHLNTPPPMTPDGKPDIFNWNNARDKLYLSLLSAMAKTLGYDFSPIDIKRTAYKPDFIRKKELESFLRTEYNIKKFNEELYPEEKIIEREKKKFK